MSTLLLLSGGIGSRMNLGSLPKQYLECKGKQIIRYSLKTFNEHPMIENIIVVCNEQWRDKLKEWIKADNIKKFVAYADPGENRQLSILNGLKVAKQFIEAEDIVIIHDAARPLVSSELISNCLLNMREYDGVMPVLPAKDTYYMIGENSCIQQCLPRNSLGAGQAPEAFRFGTYLKINEKLSYDEILSINGSSEVAVKFNLNILTIPGEERNFKITTQDDLKLMEQYLEETL